MAATRLTGYLEAFFRQCQFTSPRGHTYGPVIELLWCRVQSSITCDVSYPNESFNFRIGQVVHSKGDAGAIAGGHQFETWNIWLRATQRAHMSY